MKVYVIYDPLYEKVVCVHQYPNTECKDCKPIRDGRAQDKDNYYFLEELEREVYNDAKTYDSPAIISECVSDDRELHPEIDLDLLSDRKEEDICTADEEDQQPDSMLFHNPRTGKLQKLFDETTLNKVYTVCYRNHEVGDKGEALYITIEAESEIHAKDKAMANQEFRSHIYMKYYNSKCLSAFIPKGNYVIGKVDYYEGDPRL